MNENEDKNRNTRISQQKNKFIRNIIICVLVLVVFSVIFWAVARNSQGTEITLNEFETQLNGGHIKEIYFNNNKIQLYYQNGEAHYIYYDRGGVEQGYILSLIQGSDLENPPTLHTGTTTTVSIMSILYPIILLVGLVIMVVLIMKQLRNTNNKSFDFVKNRARIYPSKTKFTDVAGEEEEKAELEDIVDFLKNPKKYVDLGAKIPKGVLLVGPPGTGKTLLARAVAGEANVPFFTISGSDFMELFVGVGASRVRDLFETAKKAKPCIIFIDEIDAVGRQRGAGLGGGNDEREQTLNQLLVQMDGFEDNEGIIVMAATNRVDILDPALLRPGRFDRRVNISIPDVKAREEILKVHARNKPISNEVDFKTIARITSGFTGAEIENLLNESAILAAKENRTEINEEDIQKSMMKVTLGPQKRSRVIDEKDKFDTAIHESGHALISKLAKEKSPVQEVSIIPRGGAGGYTLSADDDSTVYFRQKLLCKIQMLLGGITAEKLYVGDISTGASNDLKRASDIARKMVSQWGMSSEVGMVYCGSEDEVFIGRSYQERMPYSENQASVIDSEVKKIIDMCQKETEKILTKHKDELMTMTNILLEKETIYAEEVDMIIDGKSKEEVIAYIENKNVKQTPETSQDSGENEIPQKSEENTEKPLQKSAKIVEDLLRVAEEREQEQNNSADAKDTTSSNETKKKSTKAGTSKTASKSSSKTAATKGKTKSSASTKSSAGTKTAKSKTKKSVAKITEVESSDKSDK